MGYQPDQQALEPHIKSLREALDLLKKALDERIACGEWQATHLREVNALIARITNLVIDLKELESETW